MSGQHLSQDRKSRPPRVDEPPSDDQVESLILRAWEARIISHYQLLAVLKEWREPSHEDFGARTRWSLFNAFTEVLGPFSQSNPQAFAGRTFRLNRLLVPPNEGPTDIDAAFQVVGQGRSWRIWSAARRPRARPSLSDPQPRTGLQWMRSGRATRPDTERSPHQL
jgi:hypothetical protein